MPPLGGPTTRTASREEGREGNSEEGRRAEGSETSITGARSAAPSAYSDNVASTTRQHLATAPPPNAAKHRMVSLSLLRPPPSPMDADARTCAKHANASHTRDALHARTRPAPPHAARNVEPNQHENALQHAHEHAREHARARTPQPQTRPWRSHRGRITVVEVTPPPWLAPPHRGTRHARYRGRRRPMEDPY